jgi:hypothetical protein
MYYLETAAEFRRRLAVELVLRGEPRTVISRILGVSGKESEEGAAFEFLPRRELRSEWTRSAGKMPIRRRLSNRLMNPEIPSYRICNALIVSGEHSPIPSSLFVK